MWQVLKDILKLEFIVLLKNSRWAKCCGIVYCIPIEVHSQLNKHLLSMLSTPGTKGPIAMLIAFTFQCFLNAHTKHVLFYWPPAGFPVIWRTRIYYSPRHLYSKSAWFPMAPAVSQLNDLSLLCLSCPLLQPGSQSSDLLPMVAGRISQVNWHAAGWDSAHSLL